VTLKMGGWIVWAGVIGVMGVLAGPALAQTDWRKVAVPYYSAEAYTQGAG
jgi:hypothetical protein